MGRDYYFILGIPSEASAEQIKKAFRHGAKRLHPDACPDINVEAFRELTDAYETLSDKNRRRAYDASLKPPPPASGPRPATVRRNPSPSGGPCPVMPLEQTPAFCTPMPTLDIEVRLSADLARAGGRILLALPLSESCPRCAGIFRGVFDCPLCGGLGAVETTVRVPLDIAPGTADGDRCTVVLHRQGLRLDIRFART